MNLVAKQQWSEITSSCKREEKKETEFPTFFLNESTSLQFQKLN